MSNRSRFLVGFAALTLSLAAQQTGSPPSPSGGGSQGGNTQPPSQPPAQSGEAPTQSAPQSSEAPNPGQRGSFPIVMAGKVRLDDGSIPPEPVPIERYCLGHAIVEDHTDRKGRFSFQLGGDPFPAALDTSLPILRSGPGYSAPPTGTVTSFGIGPVLMGCVIRAVLFGYRSDTVQLHDRDAQQKVDIGVITLYRLEGVRGRSTSPTSLNAPKKARKLHEKP